MVDLHSHILPGLDDGPATFDESVAMLDLAAASGTTDIVATPHCNAHFPFHPETVSRLVTQLAAHANGMPTIHKGCDFHLSYDNLRDAVEYPTKYTINDGPYLLVELPDIVSLPATRHVLRQLIAMGLIPVITHPERNASLDRQRNELESWVADGCLLQITAQSVIGAFGARAQSFAASLLRARLIHFIASDAHDTVRRPPDLRPAFQHVAARYGAARAHALFVANPTAVLHGRPLPLAAPEPRLLARLLSHVRRKPSGGASTARN